MKWEPEAPYECVEEAIDPNLFAKMQRQKDDPKFSGGFPCLNKECGGYKAKGYHNHHDCSPGEIVTEWEFIEMGSATGDYPKKRGTCPMCLGDGTLSWSRFEQEYNKIMQAHEQKLETYQSKLKAAQSAVKKLTAEEFALIKEMLM